MTVTPLPHQRLSIVSVLVREQKESDRPACRHQPESYLVRCSACNKVRIDGKWYDLREAIRQGKCAPDSDGLPVSYGICEPCRQEIHRRLHIPRTEQSKQRLAKQRLAKQRLAKQRPGKLDEAPRTSRWQVPPHRGIDVPCWQILLLVTLSSIFVLGCDSSRNSDGSQSLSWQQGMYRLERGRYREVVIVPTAIYLFPVAAGDSVDRLWNDPGLASAQRRQELNQSRSKAKQKGFEVHVRYAANANEAMNSSNL